MDKKWQNKCKFFGVFVIFNELLADQLCKLLSLFINQVKIAL